jgi:hypothetical protein
MSNDHRDYWCGTGALEEMGLFDDVPVCTPPRSQAGSVPPGNRRCGRHRRSGGVSASSVGSVIDSHARDTSARAQSKKQVVHYSARRYAAGLPSTTPANTSHSNS